MAFRLRCRFQ